MSPVRRTAAATLSLGIAVPFALWPGVPGTSVGSRPTAPAVRARPALSAPLAMDEGGMLLAHVQVQAEAQAAAARATAKRRAAAMVLRRATEKAAADRKARQAAAVAKRRAARWVRPVDHYVLGASYGLGGALWSRRHSGQDFVVPTGTAVRAVHTGIVVEAGWGGAYGNNVVIRHSPGVYTQYGHLSSIRVSVGQWVDTGQILGRSGSTGNSTGPHLHFEVRTRPVYGYSVEPLAFLRARHDPL
ncbi:M23 family metallopeptidase [Streptomyces sp. NPDC005125]